MSIAENRDVRIAYKAYASGVIASNAQAVSSTDLGASSAQVLRRVGCTLDLQKDTYQSQEIRSDAQITDFRHGPRRVGGSITGELSGGTYFDFMEAACRGTKNASAVAKSESELTSAAASASGYTITFGGGNPVTEGFRVGDIVRFTNLSVAANNSKNFLICGFSGSNNRILSVFPAPTDMSADTAFNVTTVGKSVYVPSSGFVQRKFGIEAYHQTLDRHRLFTECRVGGLKLNIPASGMVGIEIPFMGRDMETNESGSSPFFTSPTDPTTSGVMAAVNGVLRVGGSRVGIITSINIDLDLSPSTEAVVGQNYPPEIVLGRANVTTQLQAFLEDFTFVDYFKNETEVEILAMLAASSADAAQAISIHVPRNKFGSATIGLQGEQGIPISMSTQALKYETAVATAGIENTTIRITDTQAS